MYDIEGLHNGHLASPSRSGSALLSGAYRHAGQARDADPRSVDEYSVAPAAVKMKVSKAELQIGGLFPRLPILQAGDAHR